MLDIHRDADGAVRALAEAMTGALGDREGTLRVVVPGGSTPQRLYRVLTQKPWVERMPWDRIHWVLSDERCVPPEHEDSNAGMIRRVLGPGRVDRLVRVKGEASPEEAVDSANAELTPWFEQEPAFELVLLGLGEDGHTASIFPAPQPVDFGTFPVAHVFQASKGHRLTLTPRALSSARDLWFLVLGGGKAGAVAASVEAGAPDSRRPATFLPLDRCRWFLDEAAARLLPDRDSS